MRNALFLSLLILFVFSSCTPKQKAPEVLKMHDKVMEVHDEVMPISMKLKKQKKLIKNLMEEKELDDTLKQKTKDQILVLDNTYKAMMDWMAEYKQPKAETTVEDAMKYLDEELIKITKISKATDLVYKNSQSLIQTINEK